jgi:hypothetical protein
MQIVVTGHRRATCPAPRKLVRFIEAVEKRGDPDCWRRGRAVLGYVDKRPAMDFAEEGAESHGGR